MHYLHGQALNEGREYERALEMFRKASEYRPEEKEYTMRRWGGSPSSSSSLTVRIVRSFSSHLLGK